MNKQIEKIKSEINRRIEENKYNDMPDRLSEDYAILEIIDSIPEESPSRDLEDKAEKYAAEGDEISGVFIIKEEKEAFIAGAHWQKEQMMKDAVEVNVGILPLNGPLGISLYCCNYPTAHPFHNCTQGDKVKLIMECCGK